MSVQLKSVCFLFCISIIQFVLCDDVGICKRRYRMRITLICCSGYIQTDSPHALKCEPICIPECNNGYCHAPGVCKCLPGYRPDPSNRRNCLPDCGGECDNGVCTAPMTCSCNHGYRLTATPFGSQICEPVCTEPCHNGTCVQPETCNCNYGYRRSVVNTCEPYCWTGCNNGTCVGPDTCGCDDGWRLVDNNSCQPVCSPSCFNGLCVGPNTCKCNDGYQGAGNFYTCLPITTTSTTAEPATVSTTMSTAEPISSYKDILYEAISSMYADNVTDVTYSEISTTETSVGETVDAPSDNETQDIWIYIIVCVILLTAFVLMILIYKRRSLTCVKGGNYTVEAPQSKPTMDNVEFNVTFSSISRRQ